ncbi:hypothetical protein WEI85_19845 [Actinomycetes bacterium KLBMP 9797]
MSTVVALVVAGLVTAMLAVAVHGTAATAFLAVFATTAVTLRRCVRRERAAATTPGATSDREGGYGHVVHVARPPT